MRRLLEAALERNPNQRPSATELLKHEALHPPREEQPRCQSLDSALLEKKRLVASKGLELPENIAGTQLILLPLDPLWLLFKNLLRMSLPVEHTS